MIKENIKTYKKEWREKNKDKQIIYTNRWKTKNPEKYKENNKTYTKNFNLKHPEKRKKHLEKYYKKKFHCLFCNKPHLVRNKKRHLQSNKHKKNTNIFNLNISRTMYKRKTL